MDEVLQPASTRRAERYFENRIAEMISQSNPPLSSNVSSLNSYLSSRRNVLFNNYPSLIPPSQPSNPDIRISAVEAQPGLRKSG